MPMTINTNVVSLNAQRNLNTSQSSLATSMQRLIDSVNFDDEESMSWFHRTLRKWGVIDALRKAGAQEGDTVRIIDMEFDFVE